MNMKFSKHVLKSTYQCIDTLLNRKPVLLRILGRIHIQPYNSQCLDLLGLHGVVVGRNRMVCVRLSCKWPCLYKMQHHMGLGTSFFQLEGRLSKLDGRHIVSHFCIHQVGHIHGLHHQLFQMDICRCDFQVCFRIA